MPKVKKLSAIAKVKLQLSIKEDELRVANRDKDYWERCYRETDAKLRQVSYKDGQAMGNAEAREDMVHAALRRIHQETSWVKGTENSAIALQRVIGSVQGISGAALGPMGGAEPLNLYDDKTKKVERSSFGGLPHFGA